MIKRRRLLWQSQKFISQTCVPFRGQIFRRSFQKLIRKAGIGEIDFEKKMTAIKIHFGEPGNLSFLRPNYAKAVADVVKELGGRPFLTDCNTLYVGRRKRRAGASERGL